MKKIFLLGLSILLMGTMLAACSKYVGTKIPEPQIGPSGPPQMTIPPGPPPVN